MSSFVAPLPTLEDAALPTLTDALNPDIAGPQLIRRLRLGDGARLVALRVLAYKPGRRCLIEYELASEGERERGLCVIGKIRVNRFGNSGYRQLKALWDAGFDDGSRDGISVPEPLATVPGLCMWLQRKVEGRLATGLLADPPAGLAERIARAVQKLHETAVPIERHHSMADELNILRRCLGTTAAQHPEMAPALHRVLASAVRVGQSLTPGVPCPSHRDFYSDQLLLTEQRLYLLDFDLFCLADPGLDVGNFLGHLTEHAVRHLGSPSALAHLEHELEDRFVAHAGDEARRAVRVYAALTLARHVYLCTRFIDRAHLLPTLLLVAQDRLDALAAEGIGA